MKKNVERQFVSVMCLVVLLAGCAGRTPNPVQMYRFGDETRNCASLKMEISQLQADMTRMLPKTDKTKKNALLGAAGLFLIVPWFFMDFSGADKIEFEAMRQRHNHLLRYAIEKDCALVGIEAKEVPSIKK